MNVIGVISEAFAHKFRQSRPEISKKFSKTVFWVKVPEDNQKSLKIPVNRTFLGKHVCMSLSSEGEKPPKIRKKSSQEQSSWELLALLPLKRQRK